MERDIGWDGGWVVGGAEGARTHRELLAWAGSWGAYGPPEIEDSYVWKLDRAVGIRGGCQFR